MCVQVLNIIGQLSFNSELVLKKISYIKLANQFNLDNKKHAFMFRNLLVWDLDKVSIAL